MDNGIAPSDGRQSVIGDLNRYRKEIMGLAALFIFFFHHWNLVTPELLPNHPGVAELFYKIKAYGFFGVDVFFLLSGVGLVYSIDKHSVWQFYLRRLKRVYLPFLVSYIVLCAVRGDSAFRYLQIVSGYTFWFEDIYSVLWFVPAVMALYLLFPLYNLIMKKTGSCVIVTAVALALWYLGSVFLPIRGDLYGFTNRIPVFLIGVMFGRLEKDGRFPKTRWLYIASPFLLAGGIVTAELIWNRYPQKFIVRSPSCFLPTLLFALSIPFIFAFLLRLLHAKKKLASVTDALTAPLRYYGKVSLEFYLIQMFTVNGIMYPASGGIIAVQFGSKLMGNLLILAAITGLSWLLFTVSDLINKKLLRFGG